MIRCSVAGLVGYGRAKLRTSLLGLRGRSIHGGKIDDSNVNPVAIQMIDYALSLAHSLKSDESYAEGMLILEQCLASGSSLDQVDLCSAHNSMGMVLLAMSDLLFDRGKYGDAMDKLQRAAHLTHASLGVRVAAMEALAGINLQLGDEDASSVLADRCMEIVESEGKISVVGLEEARVRATSIKALVEVARGDLASAEALFERLKSNRVVAGSGALSHGEFLHVTNHLTEAKHLYQKVIEDVGKTKNFSSINTLGACNMEPKEILLAASCSLGQLESHMGNFDAAEETLTKALNGAEQTFGPRHPKIGVVLTCLALMFRNKARAENSSCLLIQEGLFRRAAELMKIPTVDSEDARIVGSMRNIAAIVRGGYGQVLEIQENRKSEGEKMRKWADAAWNNPRFSLAEVLDFAEAGSSRGRPVIDARICRAL